MLQDHVPAEDPTVVSMCAYVCARACVRVRVRVFVRADVDESMNYLYFCVGRVRKRVFCIRTSTSSMEYKQITERDPERL